MYRLTIVLVFSLNALALVSQTHLTPDSLLRCDTSPQFVTFENFQIFQFLGTDSLNGNVTYSEKHDSLGRVVAYHYKGHKENSGTGTSDVLAIKEYDNEGRLSSITSYYEESVTNDITKVFYYYRDTFLIQTEIFSYKRRIKPGVDKGDGRPSGCIITSKDYEKEKTWKLDNLIKYDYVSGVRNTSYSLITNTSQNGWEYTYDEQGRLSTKQSMNGNNVVYTEYYSYIGDTVRTDSVWNNRQWSGTKRMFIYGGIPRRLRQEVITQGENTWKKQYWYDNQGRILRYVYYNKDGSPNLTHIYRYNSNTK